jgi:hypothetical protein
MSTEDNILAFSRRITDAPEDSKEFRDVMDRLRANLKARAARGREHLAQFQKSLQHSEAPGQTLHPNR